MIGLIYKIVHDQSDIVYVGMTMTSLTKRWNWYKSFFNSKKEKKKNITIERYFREYGIENFEIVLIKAYDVVDRNHLRVYETLWMNKLKCINANASFNPMPKKQQSRATYWKYREDRCARTRAYVAANKDVVYERNRVYQEKNQEKLREYRLKNKEKFKAIRCERHTCECGGSWTKGNGFPIHERTKKHQNWLKQSDG